MYYKAAEAMVRLPQKALEKRKPSADVNDDILVYRIVGQINEPNTVFIVNVDETEQYFTSKKCETHLKMMCITQLSKVC